MRKQLHLLTLQKTNNIYCVANFQLLTFTDDDSSSTGDYGGWHITAWRPFNNWRLRRFLCQIHLAGVTCISKILNNTRCKKLGDLAGYRNAKWWYTTILKICSCNAYELWSGLLCGFLISPIRTLKLILTLLYVFKW